MELCSVGGCGNRGPDQILVPFRLGGHEVELETPLCDYHLGWHESQPKRSSGGDNRCDCDSIKRPHVYRDHGEGIIGRSQYGWIAEA